MRGLLPLIVIITLFLGGCDFTKPSEPEQNLNQPEQKTDSGNFSEEELPPAEAQPEDQPPIETPPAAPEEIIQIKTTLDIPVPFAPQAPFADWGMPYQEACEEASIIMAAKYFKDEPLDKNIMNDEILKLVEWEKNYFGFWEDSTAENVVEILDKYYNVKARTSKEVSADKIKEELNKGNLIIVPTAGRLLDNPYFSGEGPAYHMLVIRGYDRNEFITNDPGTKRGEGFKYKYDNLLNAVHDWNGTKENIYTGQKIMVVVETPLLKS
ncbi:MAG: C39 family peptidase [Patescibacteria group bacterium]|nr:C39 family peptidase [Patescibacteria group bacterium]MDD5490414.1 C39 family peptidase [Patescibacteria group bacterium]